MIKLVLFDVGNTIQDHMDTDAFARRIGYKDPERLMEFFRMEIFAKYDLEPDPDRILQTVRDFTKTELSYTELHKESF